MRVPDGRVALGLVAVVAVGIAALVWRQGPIRHGDGDGPLGSYGRPGYEAMKVDSSSGVTTWTYGVRLCREPGTEPVVIESVAPTTSLGTGFRLLGLGVRQFLPTQAHESIISTDGWPPPQSVVPDAIQDVHGFEVTTACNGGAFDPTTELLVGLALTSPDGGGWQGIEVSYTVGWRHRVLVLDHDLLICGASVDCASPGSS